MRRVQIFSGNSHPALTSAICERLGLLPAKCELTKFSNGETSVSIGTSIRDQDVFIVQSGSRRTNDSVMELLIMISACKGGSARSITAVIPYFPYSRQSKKKSHRGAITARVLANLLNVAGVQHVITVDLHAPPMRGFFRKPVDNLRAEPIIARWIRHHVPEWQDGVVVSKNAGGSKRVTSLADALKLNFGIITTERRRSPVGSVIDPENYAGYDLSTTDHHDFAAQPTTADRSRFPLAEQPLTNGHFATSLVDSPTSASAPRTPFHRTVAIPGYASPLHGRGSGSTNSPSGGAPPRSHPFAREPLNNDDVAEAEQEADEGDGVERFTDERAPEVVTGRLIQGHIVDDDFPSPVLSTMSGSMAHLPRDSIGPPGMQMMAPSGEDSADPMTASFMSVASSGGGGTGVGADDHPLGGTFDAADLSEEEEHDYKDPEIERTVTLVGNVWDRTVFIIDDILDGPESWIAAAETVVKRGNANKVYCIATHALCPPEALEELEQCDCIDYIVVSNTFPIEPEVARATTKLIVLDLSGLLAEAIRRNRHGESISQLYQQYQD